MSIAASRFELALTTMKGSDWEYFERLCSTFLATEFPGLRTTASASGDGGRDAEVFSDLEAPRVKFQYSVRKDWNAKLLETIKQIRKDFPDTTSIVFMSNQKIGAASDGIKADSARNGINIDVRDQSWFIERMDLDESRRSAALELARVFVDPLLEAKGILPGNVELKGQEARTALHYLEMQAHDEDAAKGLTKSCYDALVKCVLRYTSAENKMKGEEVYSAINKLLPRHSPHQLRPFIESSLKRLSKTVLKHWRKLDEYHLSFEEREATKDRVADLKILNDAFQQDVDEILDRTKLPDEETEVKFSSIIRNAIEIYFYRSGEEFAQSLVSDKNMALNADLMGDVIGGLSPKGKLNDGRTYQSFLHETCLDILETPSQPTRELLRLLSTAYTLFAFLSEVPDVQKATKKLFEHGVIWLDTTVILPLIAEQAFDPDLRPFTRMLAQLSRTGTKLLVTDGIMNECERHINLCKTYYRMSSGAWKGRVPYLYGQYTAQGRKNSDFLIWLEGFAGEFRPIEDLLDFLSDTANIELAETPELSRLDTDVIYEVREYWRKIHDKRRRGDEGFSINAHRLSEHDSENYLAALAQRKRHTGASVLGYSSWYLTLDSAAWSLLKNVDKDVAKLIGHAPLISIDFLMKYLAFGPRRDQIDTSGVGWSRIFIAPVFETIPKDVIEVAEKVRTDNVGLPERLIRRRIRDELDKQRMAAGVAQKAGLEGAESAFLGEL